MAPTAVYAASTELKIVSGKVKKKKEKVKVSENYFLHFKKVIIYEIRSI